jgi:hypothetical protein
VFVSVFSCSYFSFVWLRLRICVCVCVFDTLLSIFLKKKFNNSMWVWRKWDVCKSSSWKISAPHSVRLTLFCSIVLFVVRFVCLFVVVFCRSLVYFKKKQKHKQPSHR